MPTDAERFKEMCTGEAMVSVNVPRVNLNLMLTDRSQLHLRRLADRTWELDQVPSPWGNLAAQAKDLIREVDWANPYKPTIIFGDGGSREFPLPGDPRAIVAQASSSG